MCDNTISLTFYRKCCLQIYRRVIFYETVVNLGVKCVSNFVPSSDTCIWCKILNASRTRNYSYTSIIDNVFFVDYRPFQKENFKTLDTTTLWFYSEDSFRKRRKAKPNSYRILSQATSTITATLTVSSGLVCDKFPCSAWTNFHPNKQTGTVKAACQRVPPNTRVFVGPVTMAPINVDPWRLRWGAARVPRHSII